MTHSLHPEYRTHDAHENYTIGGLLLYAAAAPVLVAFLTAPALLLALALGFVTARGASRLRNRGPGETDEGTRYRITGHATFDNG
jgi:hypothetical protein